MARKDIGENADHDYRMPRPQQKNVTITPHDFRSRSAPKVRYTGNYADNAMDDPAKLNENGDMLDSLHAMLQPIMSDQDILGGVSLTDAGFQKVAGKFGISADEARMLFNSLKTKIKRNQEIEEDAIREFKGDPLQRYTYEKDYLGNVTIRDAETGAERFIRGPAAKALLKRLETDTNTQALLAKFSPVSESWEDEAEHGEALEKTGFWGKAGSGCIVMARSTGRILLAHRSEFVEQPHTWGGWGGAIDRGYSPEENALKELHEESGFNGQVIAHHPLYVFEDGKSGFKYFNFLFVVPDEFHVEIGPEVWETQGYKWVEFGKWPQPLHFGLKSLFSDAKSVEIIKAELKKSQAQSNSPVTESYEIIDEDDNYDAEIEQARYGSYNFPWVVKGQNGFATISYRFVNGQMKMSLKMVLDGEGHDITNTLSEDMIAHIKEQAVDYIHKV